MPGPAAAWSSAPPAPGGGPSPHGGRRLRVLVVTQQFPSSLDPLGSPFNRQQFAALARRCDVEVLAPIPWFPGARLLGGRAAAGRLRSLPRREVLGGLEVTHPRYLHVPRYGHFAAAALYAASLAPAVLRRRGRFDVLLSSWAYPDGVAAVLLAKLLGIPAVVKVSGSDLNVNARHGAIAANLRWGLPRARRIVAVSRPLADVARSFGVAADRIDVIRNGVDASLFHVRERAPARALLGHAGDGLTWLLFVGRLLEAKGVRDLLEAFAILAARRPDVRLVLLGDGPERAACERAAAGPFGDRILVAGGRPLEEVPIWMAACDALVLPSWAEGSPNVVVEALTCGRRVVATSVGGIPDLITSPALGELVPARSPALLAAALDRAAGTAYAPAEVARLGARYDWDESARLLEASLSEAVG